MPAKTIIKEPRKVKTAPSRPQSPKATQRVILRASPKLRALRPAAQSPLPHHRVQVRRQLDRCQPPAQNSSDYFPRKSFYNETKRRRKLPLVFLISSVNSLQPDAGSIFSRDSTFK